MRLSLCTALLCLVCVLCQQARAEPETPLISIQIHSWDDLEEMPQMLHKLTNLDNVIMFKLDPHFTSWNATSACTSPYCFVLIHDKPVKDGGPYNTLDSLLDVISDPAYAFAFSRSSRIKKTLIALCYKSNGWFVSPCAGTPEANAWLALNDAFFARAEEIIRKYDLNVEFILDGDANFMYNKSCLYDRWRPLVATWTQRPGAVDSDPWLALFDDNKTMQYDRYQVMNIGPGATDLLLYFKGVQLFNYGKFKGRAAYPLQFWEPSDQAKIWAVSTLYLRHGYAHPAPMGFRFAINADPVQHEVFNGQYSRRAWNIRLPLLNYEQGAAFVHVISPLSRDTSSGLLVVFQKDLDLLPAYSVAGIFEKLVTVQPILSSPMPVPLGPFAKSNFSVAAVHAAAANGSDLVLLLDSSRMFVLNKLEDGVMSHVTSGTLSPCRNPSSFSVELTCDDVIRCSLFAVCETATGSVSIDVYELKTVGKRIEFIQSGTLGPLPTNLMSNDIASSSTLSLTASNDGSLRGLLAVTGSVSRNVMVHVIRIEHSRKSITVDRRGAMGVGTGLTSHVLPDGHFIIGVRDACCYHNNDNNKNAHKRLCLQTCKSTPGVLAYSTGTLDQLISSLGSTRSPVCWDSGITYGTYDAGFEPCVTLVSGGSSRTFDGDSRRFAAVAIHKGTTGSYSNNGCGLPVPFPGLVLDGWMLPL